MRRAARLLLACTAPLALAGCTGWPWERPQLQERPPEAAAAPQQQAEAPSSAPTATEPMAPPAAFPDWPLPAETAQAAELFAAQMHAAMLRRDGYLLTRDSSTPFWFNGTLITDIANLQRGWRDAEFGPLVQGPPQIMAVSPGMFQSGGLAEQSRWFTLVGLKPQDVVAILTFTAADGRTSHLTFAMRRLERGFLLAGLQN